MSISKVAIITGITGQDGFFLTQLLEEKKYEIHGVIRMNSSMSKGTLDFQESKAKEKVQIHYGGLTDAHFFSQLLSDIIPDEFYHSAAQSFVGYSFKNPSSTYEVNINGTLNVVNAIKDHSPDTMLYFAATSELFGQPKAFPQNELTPFQPRSPHAIYILAGYWSIKDYRNAYLLYMSNGVLFNHEYEVRGPEFVTRKISMHMARIVNGSKGILELWNLYARKDLGYAKDFVYGIWLMMNYKFAEDFALGTGESHTVRGFVEETFHSIGQEIFWKEKGLNEVGLSEKDEAMVRVNEQFFRPLEADNYMADLTKARVKIGGSL